MARQTEIKDTELAEAEAETAGAVKVAMLEGMDDDEVQALTVDELKDKARDAEIVGFSSMNKDDLIAALRDYDSDGDVDDDDLAAASRERGAAQVAALLAPLTHEEYLVIVEYAVKGADLNATDVLQAFAGDFVGGKKIAVGDKEMEVVSIAGIHIKL